MIREPSRCPHHHRLSREPAIIRFSPFAVSALLLISTSAYAQPDHQQNAKTLRIVAAICKPLQKLGAMSYSLYIVHFPVLAMISAIWLAYNSSLPQTPFLLIGGIAATLIVARLTYYVAERPFLSRRPSTEKREQPAMPALSS